MNDSKEYIERGALIDSFEGCYFFYNSTDRETAMRAINNVPAADVAPVVHGEWETDKEDIEWGNSLKKKYCSVCGKRPWYDRTDREFVLTPFCPNCGAKMDGGKRNV